MSLLPASEDGVRISGFNASREFLEVEQTFEKEAITDVGWAGAVAPDYSLASSLREETGRGPTAHPARHAT